MLQKNISGKDTDYYRIENGSVMLSITPLIDELNNRIKSESEYGPGFFDVTVNRYIDECEKFFKKAPTSVWQEIKSEITRRAPNVIKSHQVKDNVKPMGMLGTIVCTALACTFFGVTSYLMIPLLN